MTSTSPGPRHIALSDLAGHAGQTLGHSGWRTVTQEMVNRFADATGDHQWIHVDEERAKSGPFGRTIAHGYLTLSMAPVLLFEVLSVGGVGLVINYGANRVRFPAPLLVGSQVRATVDLLDVGDEGGGVQTSFRMTFDAEGSPKPVCVAEIVFRFYPESSAG